MCGGSTIVQYTFTAMNILIRELSTPINTEVTGQYSVGWEALLGTHILTTFKVGKVGN